MSNDDKKTLNDKQILSFSKIQLVVYYQCCVLIGWATTRLHVIAHYVAKSAGFLPAKKDESLGLSCFVSIFLTIQLDLTKTIIPLALMASE